METNSQIIVKNTKKISQLPLAENIQNYLDTTYFILSGHFGSEDDGALATKRISAKAFIEDITANDDIQQSLNDLFEYSTITAIENSYLLVERDTSDARYAHALRYRLNRQLPEFNENYTTLAQDGLIDASTMLSYGATLENRFNSVLNVILNEPGTDNIIDTIIEFTNWFNGWTSNENNLRQLLSKISDDINTAKTEAINTSKNYTDTQITQLNQTITQEINDLDVSNQITNKINELDVSTIGGNDKYIKSISEADGKISAEVGNISDIRSTLASGTNISITNNETINCTIGLDSTNNKSFTIGNSKYSLNFVGGQFYISEANNPYVQITLTLNSPSSATLPTIEYNDENALTTIDLSATPSKDCTIVSGTTSNWATSSNTIQNADVAIVKNNVECSKTKNFTATLKVKEILTQDEIDYGGNTAKTASITVKRNIIYDSWRYFNDTALNLTNGLTSTDFANFSKLNDKNSNGYSSQYNFTDSEMSGGKYVYILIKKSSGTFILGSGTTPGKFPGGVTNTEKTYKPYGTGENAPTYYLYMVTERQSGAFNITVS